MYEASLKINPFNKNAYYNYGMFYIIILIKGSALVILKKYT